MNRSPLAQTKTCLRAYFQYRRVSLNATPALKAKRTLQNNNRFSLSRLMMSFQAEGCLHVSFYERQTVFEGNLKIWFTKWPFCPGTFSYKPSSWHALEYYQFLWTVCIIFAVVFSCLTFRATVACACVFGSVIKRHHYIHELKTEKIQKQVTLKCLTFKFRDF